MLFVFDDFRVVFDSVGARVAESGAGEYARGPCAVWNRMSIAGVLFDWCQELDSHLIICTTQFLNSWEGLGCGVVV